MVNQWKDDVVLSYRLPGCSRYSFGGYLMTGGSLRHYQPAELVIIASYGDWVVIVGNNGKAIKGTLKGAAVTVSSLKYTKAIIYGSAGSIAHRLMAKSRQMGMFRWNIDIENPRESEIFAATRILADSVMLILSSIICA